jgi:hypothetical protein
MLCLSGFSAENWDVPGNVSVAQLVVAAVSKTEG